MNIEIHRLSKRFARGFLALDQVNLTIPEGVYGLLGPNGAGKTTLMRILATLMAPDEGSVKVGEIELTKNPQAVRQLLGYLPQDVGFYRQLTAAEYLELVAGMKGIPRPQRRRQVEQVLEQVRLAGQPRKLIGQFSGGMKRRLGIAQALLGDPRVLIVDEPTAGLDPEERVHFRNIVSDLTGGRIVLLSTHIVADVESVCSHIAVLNHGRIVYQGSLGGLLEQASGKVWQVELPDSDYERLRSSLQVVSSRRTAGGMSVRVVAPERPFGLGSPVEPGLEDGYLCLMGGLPQ